MNNPTINGKAYNWIGTTDEVTQCGCCGRDGLKGTVVLREADGGEFVFFGSVCASKAVGWGVKEVNAAAKAADKAKIARERAISNAVYAHPRVRALQAAQEPLRRAMHELDKDARVAERLRLGREYDEVVKAVRAELEATM